MTERLLRIYHNPRCSKSRALLQQVQARGLPAEVVLYLEQPPTMAQLQALLAKLGRPVREIIRHDEAIYRQLQLQRPELSEADLLEAISLHPRLLQRPILETDTRAVLGRPPEAAEALLQSWSKNP